MNHELVCCHKCRLISRVYIVTNIVTSHNRMAVRRMFAKYILQPENLAVLLLYE